MQTIAPSIPFPVFKSEGEPGIASLKQHMAYFNFQCKIRSDYPMASLFWFAAESKGLLDQESGFPGAPPMKSCYVNNGFPAPELEYLGAFLKNSKRHQDVFDHPVIAAMIWAKWSHWQRRQRYLLHCSCSRSLKK